MAEFGDLPTSEREENHCLWVFRVLLMDVIVRQRCLSVRELDWREAILMDVIVRQRCLSVRELGWRELAYNRPSEEGNKTREKTVLSPCRPTNPVICRAALRTPVGRPGHRCTQPRYLRRYGPIPYITDTAAVYTSKIRPRGIHHRGTSKARRGESFLTSDRPSLPIDITDDLPRFSQTCLPTNVEHVHYSDGRSVPSSPETPFHLSILPQTGAKSQPSCASRSQKLALMPVSFPGEPAQTPP
ncbi:hypothetical protein Bbelb_007750 [Branchiostoma belcheri]|nr:hypothetical protein Bbelb_007750 [Branchiostoma belcheri]